ncbi:glycoside hydrolase family 3 C-terminal domain-containing protein [Actinoplanes sp. NPDC026623]|uniref:glycoside hydrolase family 3 protein n=1 Tax=Actinoplanes sp. NPDC026623 TaxID=3155610 RepID=UPI00340F5968
MAAANPATVVVLQTGGPVVMPWIDSVRAVLEAWYAGEQVGPAVAALLWGDTAASGKLAHTFPRSEAELPTAGDPERYPGTFADGSVVRPPGSDEPRHVEYKEGLQVGYRWYAAQDIEPLVPFGHGLTYTTFRYDRPQVTPSVTTGGRDLRIRFRLTNTGKRTGTETAQAYVELPARPVSRPSGCSPGGTSRWPPGMRGPSTWSFPRPTSPTCTCAVLERPDRPMDHRRRHVPDQRRRILRRLAERPVQHPLTIRAWRRRGREYAGKPTQITSRPVFPRAAQAARTGESAEAGGCFAGRKDGSMTLIGVWLMW